MNKSLVLVVCRSRVNGIVVSRIVAQMGLQAQIADPQEAVDAANAEKPGTILIEASQIDGACLALAAALRDAVGDASRPAVVLLTTSNVRDDLPEGIRATVAMPITPERLQTVLGSIRNA